MTAPRFLLLDEPFTSIDPIAVADVQRIMLQLKQRGIGVIITDHNVRETLRIVDRGLPHPRRPRLRRGPRRPS